MEYCAGGDLFNHVLRNGPYEEENAKEIMRRLVSAVAYLHSPDGGDAQIIHRDLKPEVARLPPPARTDWWPPTAECPHCRRPTGCEGESRDSVYLCLLSSSSFSPSSLEVTDFGLSRVFPGGPGGQAAANMTAVGSPGYAAPEVPRLLLRPCPYHRTTEWHACA